MTISQIMNAPITLSQSLIISLVILVVVALIAALFELPNMRKKSMFAEQDEQNRRWDQAEKIRGNLGLCPGEYDQQVFNTYRADPPLETQSENMHRVLRSNYPEPREEFTHLKR